MLVLKFIIAIIISILFLILLAKRYESKVGVEIKFTTVDGDIITFITTTWCEVRSGVATKDFLKTCKNIDVLKGEYVIKKDDEYLSLPTSNIKAVSYRKAMEKE